ncbi:unnamed protein product [Hermetia illucens]|uniref:Uncharacterized protein n=1 Tax=Hermetia illucens TaxID=343691 RepID=A0A7R8UCA8_HERIL|nr:unnamed protein product [Hermetia illucens]
MCINDNSPFQNEVPLVMADVIVMDMVTKELEAVVEAVMEAVMEAKEDLVDTTAAMVVTDHTVVDVVVTTEDIIGVIKI